MKSKIIAVARESMLEMKATVKMEETLRFESLIQLA